MKPALLAAALLLPLAAAAQTPVPSPAAMPAPIHATITKVGHGAITVKTEAGLTLLATLTPATRIELLTRKALADLKPGEFVGSGAFTDQNGVLHAQEVHIFPQPGMGEGHRQMGPDATHTMTNATIAKVAPGVNGEAVTLHYKGGQQTITVAPETPIVAMQAGAASDLKPGLPVTLIARPAASGPVTLLAVMLGRDGAKPPL